MKKLKEIIICLIMAYLLVSPIIIAISFTQGWKVGFEACSKTWNDNIDKILLDSPIKELLK